MQSDTKGFPHDIKRLSKEESALAFKEGGYEEYFIRVGSHGYFFSNHFEALFPKTYNMELRPDDVFLVSYPKSGTTWTQELVWLIANDFDFDTANTVSLFERFPFLEISVFHGNLKAEEQINKACEGDKSKLELVSQLKLRVGDITDNLEEMRSPRFIQSHQPLSNLPPNILEKAKVIYVARDPRDVAVSYYHHERAMKIACPTYQFKEFWELFKRDMVLWTPFFAHLREAWELRDHPNMLFLSYEDISKDLPDVIRRVAKFLGKNAPQEKIATLCEHLKIENFRNNKMVNHHTIKELGLFKKDEHFIRKGKVGGWRDYFDEEMAKDAQQWMEEGLQGIDFEFPDF